MEWTLLSATASMDVWPAWDRLCSEIEAPLFLKSVFICHLLRVFGTGNELLGICESDGRYVAMCVLSKEKRAAWQTWQPSQLPLGAWLMRPQIELARLMQALLRALPGYPLVAAATQLDPKMYDRPPSAGRLQSMDYIDIAWIDIDRSFDEYWGDRSKKFRQNWRTQNSRLRRDGIVASLDELSEPGSVRQAINQYGFLESSGWKGREGSAVSAENEQGQFYRMLMEDYCRTGQGRIYQYRFGDTVVAMDLCVEYSGTQVLLKTAYDESIKGLSPATLMRHDIYQRVFDEGRIKRLEYFGEIFDWTKRWTDNRRGLYHLNFYRWPALPKILSSVHKPLSRS